MAKLPRYMKLKYHGKYRFSVIIKKWGIPILVYKTLKKRFILKWYHWLLYPYFCFKFLRGGING